MKKIACLVLVGVLLAGCAGTSGSTDEDPPEGTNADKGTSEATPAPTKKAKDETPSFGQSYTYDDGITIKVSKPEEYELSDSAFVDKTQDTYLKFGIRIVNKSGEPFDASLFTASMQSGNEEMEQVFDSEKLEDPPTTKLLDGREAKFPIVFSAKDPDDLVFQVSPDYEHDSVIFTP